MSRLEKRVSDQRVMHKKRVLFLICSFFAMLAVACATYFIFAGDVAFEKVKRPINNILSGTGKITVLVMGVDERADDVGRSDTLFVATVDTNTKEVAMLSVPRDTRMRIPGHGWDKINHAYAYGGYKLSMQAVEDLLGIPIDYYVLINLKGFTRIIDAIGGVDLHVEKRMYYTDPYDDDGGLVIDLKPGMQHMDGKTAIQYVRYRDEEGDIGRIQRQQNFLKAVLTQVASPAIITKVPALIKEVSGLLKTDMSTNEMLNLAKIINDAAKQGLKTDMVPGKPAYISDVSYWLPDIVELRDHVAKTLGLKPDEKYANTARQLAGEYETSIPKEMKIVELPKTDSKANQQDKDKKKAADADKTAKQPLKPNGKVTVDILNASGSPAAAEKMAAILRGQGFEVAGITTIGGGNRNTVITTHTDESAVVSKLTTLPFQYVLQVDSDSSKSTHATVVVGGDFAGVKKEEKDPPPKKQ